MPVETPASASPRLASVAAKAPRSRAPAATCCSRSCSLRRGHRRALSLDIKCSWSASSPRSVARRRLATFASGVARSARGRSALSCTSSCCAFRESGLRTDCCSSTPDRSLHSTRSAAKAMQEPGSGSDRTCCTFREPGLRTDCCSSAQTGVPPGSSALATKPRIQYGLVGLPGCSARRSEKTARLLLRTALRSQIVKLGLRRPRGLRGGVLRRRHS